MKILSVVLLSVCFITSCNTLAEQQKEVSLSAEEKKQVLSLGDKRADLNAAMLKENNEHQVKINRLQEQQNDINLESLKLGNQLKRKHALNAKDNFYIDENRGVLVKQ